MGEKGRGPGRAVYGPGCGSAAAGGAAGGGGLGRGVCRGVCMSVQELSYCLCLPCCCTVLLQHGADPNIRNTDGKSALDLAEPSAKAVLTGQSPVCISVCQMPHTHTHISTCLYFCSHSLLLVFCCRLQYLSCSRFLVCLSLFLYFPQRMHISTSILMLTFFAHNVYFDFVQGCRQYHLLFLSIYHPLILQGCASYALTTRVIQSLCPRLLAH